MASKPATAETGFIYSMPPRQHALHSDTGYLRVISWYLPDDILTSVKPELATIAEEASSERIKTWTCDAEVRQPYVRTHNVWGARYDVDQLVTSEGWKSLRKWGAHNGYALFFCPSFFLSVY